MEGATIKAAVAKSSEIELRGRGLNANTLRMRLKDNKLDLPEPPISNGPFSNVYTVEVLVVKPDVSIITRGPDAFSHFLISYRAIRVRRLLQSRNASKILANRYNNGFLILNA